MGKDTPRPRCNKCFAAFGKCIHTLKYNPNYKKEVAPKSPKPKRFKPWTPEIPM